MTDPAQSAIVAVFFEARTLALYLEAHIEALPPRVVEQWARLDHAIRMAEALPTEVLLRASVAANEGGRR